MGYWSCGMLTNDMMQTDVENQKKYEAQWADTNTGKHKESYDLNAV